jgi:hypothetical protein
MKAQWCLLSTHLHRHTSPTQVQIRPRELNSRPHKGCLRSNIGTLAALADIGLQRRLPAIDQERPQITGKKERAIRGSSGMLIVFFSLFAKYIANLVLL